MIKVKCPRCSRAIEASNEAVGFVITCPTCNTQIRAARRLLPPEPPVQNRTRPVDDTATSDKKMGWFIFLGVGILCVVSVIIGIAVGNGSGSSAKASDRGIEEQLAATLEGVLNQDKQKIFDSIHPTGVAENIKVHDVEIVSWKRGKNHENFESIQQFTARYTLYWRGPITTDGYTKMTNTFDNESKRWIGFKILATNGVTNQDVAYAIGYIGAAAMCNALNGDNQNN